MQSYSSLRSECEEHSSESGRAGFLSGSTISCLWDLAQVTKPLCDSVSSIVKVVTIIFAS